MGMFTLSVFEWKYLFLANWVPKFEIIQNQIWYLDYFEYAELNSDVHLF